jgi:hypothetical protein
MKKKDAPNPAVMSLSVVAAYFGEIGRCNGLRLGYERGGFKRISQALFEDDEGR